MADEEAGVLADEEAGGLADEEASGLADEEAGGLADEEAGGLADEEAGGLADGLEVDEVLDEVELDFLASLEVTQTLPQRQPTSTDMPEETSFINPA